MDSEISTRTKLILPKYIGTSSISIVLQINKKQQSTPLSTVLLLSYYLESQRDDVPVPLPLKECSNYVSYIVCHQDYSDPY